MFVHPSRLKTLGAVILGTFTLGACTDPVADTDLRPAGPPEVLAVLVFNDDVNGFVESATYCKPGDEKRPGVVGITILGISPAICPIEAGLPGVPELTDASPNGWYVRLMFDELLDPSIETLNPILDASGAETGNFSGSLAESQPVTLKCQDVNGVLTDVPYDGYYNASGNNVTFPLGPSIVIKPADPSTIPVESECEVALKDNIKDKDGNSVPTDQRGAYKFKIAPISAVATFPDGTAPINAFQAAFGFAGGFIDMNVDLGDQGADVCTTANNVNCVRIEPADKALNQAAILDGVDILFLADLQDGETYTLKTPAPGFKLKDKCGKESTVANMPAEIEFKTNKLAMLSINPGGGTAVSPSKKIVLSFNQRILASSFVKDVDFTISPEPPGFGVQQVSATQIRLIGAYNLGTNYVLTVKSGAQVSDLYDGASLIGQGVPPYSVKTFTFATEQVVNFTTTSAIALTAVTLLSSESGTFPGNSTTRSVTATDGATITKETDTSAVRIQMAFNQDILPVATCQAPPCPPGIPVPNPPAKTFDASDFTLTKADGSAVGVPFTVAVSAANARVTSILPGGSYIFTFKKDATFTDTVPTTANTYTQAADRVIHFTVKVDPPPGPDFKCLGAP